MLVLGRKLNETIVIGNDITLTVVEIANGKVRLGFDAPRDVPILRAEIVEAAKKQPAAAGGNDPGA